MPYIKQEDRSRLNAAVELFNSLNIQGNGDLNYILFKYCKNHIKPGYLNYKAFAGELEECAAEIRRRLTGPHEDRKIEENGDV